LGKLLQWGFLREPLRRIFAFAKIAHLSDDETVAKMGHPAFWRYKQNAGVLPLRVAQGENDDENGRCNLRIAG
jgi:hypothetical protein